MLGFPGNNPLGLPKDHCIGLYKGILFSILKEGNPDILDSMAEPGRHYVK
jgi:hypothetical protein